MMPISSVGATNSRRGVSLLELLIVVTLIGLVAGLSYPSIASGLDSLRLRSASNAIVAFLDATLDRADRHQQVVEIRISPKENSMIARAADLSFVRRLDMPAAIQIISVLPAAQPDAPEPRRFLMYPGGTVPAIGVEIATQEGHRRIVSVDPMTGVPQSRVVTQ
ncbi:MAG: prepilin-type N-terminal cleavage/methylation domain-containing protein [Bryobacteraceae bacterium]